MKEFKKISFYDLDNAIRSYGMTPPDKWEVGVRLRFPGKDKGRNNKAGWCYIHQSMTMAIFGDWSQSKLKVYFPDNYQEVRTKYFSNLSIEDKITLDKLRKEKLEREKKAFDKMISILESSRQDTHPYLCSKGFYNHKGLVDRNNNLVIRMNAPNGALQSLQLISDKMVNNSYQKKFMFDRPAVGAIHVIGGKLNNISLNFLCEGYAKGLAIKKAVNLCMPQARVNVITCFSASNIVNVAENISKYSISKEKTIVFADNDVSKTGQIAAEKTKLPYIITPEVGVDVNSFEQKYGILSLVEIIRNGIINSGIRYIA